MTDKKRMHTDRVLQGHILGLVSRLMRVVGGAVVSQRCSVLVVVHNLPTPHPGAVNIGIKFIIWQLTGIKSVFSLKFVPFQKREI